ncbi:hypothetical protein V5799_033506, partial [Amblyomma americanum]
HGIVYPRLLTARGDSGEKVLKINDNIALSLEKSKVFSGDFLLFSEANGESVHYYMKEDDYEKNLYHNDEHQASLLLDTEDGVKVEGIISNTLRIKPLLEMARSDEGQIAHSLYEIEPPTAGEPTHRDYAVGNTTGDGNYSSYTAEARSAKDVLYPEIHIVVDSAYAKHFNYDKKSITLYLAVLVNAANLRYKSIQNPRIQLRIVAITVSETEESYLVIPGRDRNQILDEETLIQFNNYYRGKRAFEESDLTFLITG